MTCRVCMDRRIDCAFCPCGHVACCLTCAGQLDICPLCRSDVHNRQVVFLPGTPETLGSITTSEATPSTSSPAHVTRMQSRQSRQSRSRTSSPRSWSALPLSLPLPLSLSLTHSLSLSLWQVNLFTTLRATYLTRPLYKPVVWEIHSPMGVGRSVVYPLFSLQTPKACAATFNLNHITIFLPIPYIGDYTLSLSIYIYIM